MDEGTTGQELSLTLLVKKRLQKEVDDEESCWTGQREEEEASLLMVNRSWFLLVSHVPPRNEECQEM